MFRFNQTIIREPIVCASLKLQYWRQLKYFVIELFGRLAAYAATRPNFIAWMTFLGTCLSFTFCAGRSHCAKIETFRVITRNLFTCHGRDHEAVSISICVFVAVCYVSSPSVLHE
jgi:hypothetical protein